MNFKISNIPGNSNKQSNYQKDNKKSKASEFEKLCKHFSDQV